MSTAPIEHAYTAIWQSPNPHELEWIEAIFGPYLAGQRTDGKHALVLDDCILMDAFVYCQDIAYYERFRGKNAFLVHFLDENFEGSYEKIYRNFRGVFRCHWANVFNEKYIKKFPIGYCSGMAPLGRPVERASTRRYLWSFVGAIGKSSRPDMARALRTVEPHYLYSTDDAAGLIGLKNAGRPRRLSAMDASQVLLDSTFSPSPMGNVALECFRVYEALECGSIPIVEKRWTLDYFRELLGEHPIPTVRSWGEARDLIKRYAADGAQVDALQERCQIWWEDYKRGLTKDAGAFLRDRAGDPEPVNEPIMLKKYSRPGWRTIELLRHHDARAFVRRVQRQVTRVLQKGTFRVAHRPGVKID